MRRKLVPFSMILMILLLVGTVNAYTDNDVNASNISEKNTYEESISEGNITEESVYEENTYEENTSEDYISEEDVFEGDTTEEEISGEENNEGEISEEDVSEDEVYEENISEEENSEENNYEEEVSEEENYDEDDYEEISENESSEENDYEEEISEDDTNGIAQLSYNSSGPFKAEDIVGITATFNKSVSSATLTVNDGFSSPIDMEKLNDTVWYCEYVVSSDVNSAVDVVISAVDEDENSIEETDTEAFVIDNTAPELIRNEPELDFVSTNYVVFNFSAYDEVDESVNYTFFFNGTETAAGELIPDECKRVEFELDEGHYTWEIKLEDDAGNTWSSDVVNLYVDTEAPKVTLISPDDHLIGTDEPLNFTFTAKDDFTNQYEDLKLHYEVSLDGEIIEEQGSGDMHSSEYIQVPCSELENGAHEWSVYIYDDAGNNVTSDSRYIYVDKEDLRVLLVSPDGGYSSADTVFKFRVSGGSGLPFDYKLLINGEEADCTVYEEESDILEEEEEEEEEVEEEEIEEVDEEEIDEEEENNISEDEEDEDSFLEDENDDIFEEKDNTLFLSEDPVNYYSLKADVPDGEGIEWTVLITDCNGDTYQPDPYYFSLDTVAPERVKNLTAIDISGNGEDADNYCKLYVTWDENTEDDLMSMPYEVFVSDFAPSSLEQMEKIGSTSDTSFYIDEYGDEPLKCGKDYWVAVIAKDKVGNYNNCFVSIYGPVSTFGDVPESLEEAFSETSSGLLTETEESGTLNNSTSNVSSDFLTENEDLSSGDLNNSTLNSSELLTEEGLSGNSDYLASNVYSGLKGNENSEQLREKSKFGTFENFIPQLSTTALKSSNLNSADKQVSKYNGDSTKKENAPGFHTIYSVIGILLAFGSSLRRKPGAKL